MEIEYSYMFHVPIFKVHLNPWDEIKKDILKIISNTTLVDAGGYKTDYDVNSNNEYSSEIYNIVFPHLKDITEKAFRKNLPKDPPLMWFQTYEKESCHEVHNHGNRGLSAIIYVDYDEFVHKPTKFYSPFEDFFTGYQQDYTPIIKEGDMVIFPSVIRHTSQIQTSNKQRSIISFNLFPSG